MSVIRIKCLACFFFFIVGIYVLLCTLLVIGNEHDAGLLVTLIAFTWPISGLILIIIIILSVLATFFALIPKPRSRSLVFLGIVTIPYELFAIGVIMASGGNVFPLSEFLSISAVGYAAEIISMAYAVTTIALSFPAWCAER